MTSYTARVFEFPRNFSSRSNLCLILVRNQYFEYFRRLSKDCD
jgi:hypothetical protein